SAAIAVERAGDLQDADLDIHRQRIAADRDVGRIDAAARGGQYSKRVKNAAGTRFGDRVVQVVDIVGVVAGAADHGVGPSAAVQDISAGAAAERVGIRVAGEGVVEGAADEILDRVIG